MVGIWQRKQRGRWRGSGLGAGRRLSALSGDWVFPVPKPSTLGLTAEAKEGGAQGDLTLSELPSQTWAHGEHGTHLGRIDDGRW